MMYAVLSSMTIEESISSFAFSISWTIFLKYFISLEPSSVIKFERGSVVTRLLISDIILAVVGKMSCSR